MTGNKIAEYCDAIFTSFNSHSKKNIFIDYFNLVDFNSDSKQIKNAYDLSNYLNRLKNRNDKYAYIKLNYKCNLNDVINKISSIIAYNGNTSSSIICACNPSQGIVKVEK